MIFNIVIKLFHCYKAAENGSAERFCGREVYSSKYLFLVLFFRPTSSDWYFTTDGMLNIGYFFQIEIRRIVKGIEFFHISWTLDF